MRKRGWLTLVSILLCAPSGCLWTGDAEPASWLNRFGQQPISADLAQLHIAVIERPIGDSGLDDEVWQNADELVCRRDALEDNGFRIGQLVGGPSHALQQMLLSNQGCMPKGMVFPPDRSMPIEIGAMRGRTAYQVVQSRRTTDVQLNQAGFMLDVTASLMKDGVKLTFTPKVETGEAELPFHARPDQSTWELRKGPASRVYADLSWDIVLKTNQYLLIGCQRDRLGSLGATMFTDANSQRLLVIRNTRTSSAETDCVHGDGIMPLAVQAQNTRR